MVKKYWFSEGCTPAFSEDLAPLGKTNYVLLADYNELEDLLGECIDKKIDAYEYAYAKLETLVGKLEGSNAFMDHKINKLTESHAELVEALEYLENYHTGMESYELEDYIQAALQKARRIEDETVE